MRVNGGVWAGYVAIPPTHPWRSMGDLEDDDSIHVHGGVTFNLTGKQWNELNDSPNCPMDSSYRARETDLIVGFDCGHAGDLRPNSNFNTEDSVYRDIDFVTEETKHLAQLAYAASVKSAEQSL